MWYHLGAKVYRKNYQMCTKQWSKSKFTSFFKQNVTSKIGNKSEISEADRSATKRSRHYTVKCDCDSSDWSSIGRQISKSRLRIRMHCRQSRLLSDRSKQVSWVLCWLRPWRYFRYTELFSKKIESTCTTATGATCAIIKPHAMKNAGDIIDEIIAKCKKSLLFLIHS